MTNVQSFLKKHNQSSSQIDIGAKIREIHDEMHKGLSGSGSLAMIPTYLGDIQNVQKNSKKLLIDAGGTNFRAAVGYFDQNGKVVIDNILRTYMPGTKGRLGKKEFYDAIRDNVKPLLQDTTDVGFCFSYAVKMEKDIDGIVAPFTKEVDAPEVVGTKVGKCTLDAIKQCDDKQRNIVILNDTVATLLGGKASSIDKKYSTYIGYIYGTGLNLCYIEDTQNIVKMADKPNIDKMIINIEAGNFDKFEMGDFDKLVVNSTADPKRQLFEKMTSGKYLAQIIYQAMLQYADDKLFSKDVHIEPFDLKDVSAFLQGEEGKIFNFFDNTLDRTDAKELCTAIIDRSAKMGAIFNGAIALLKGQPKGNAVAIVAEGTTFSKLTGYKAMFVKYLHDILDKHDISFEIVQGEELNLVGTLMATMAHHN